jgi:signal transduction histidine kinase
MATPSSVLFSLQSKLMLAFALVVLAALAFAGSVFVFLRRDEQEDQAIEHVIAASPGIYSEFNFLQRRGDPWTELATFVDAASDEQDVRILLVDLTDGTVVADSEDELALEQVVINEDIQASFEQPVPGQPYISWHPSGPGSDLILVSALPSRLREVSLRGAEPYWVVFAVPQNTVTRAWLDLLPSLGVAAAIAVPLSAVLAMLIAAYITRPLTQLTHASQRIAEGHFDVEVSVDRSDEVGRLAKAFTSMAHRVGEAQSQMRALVANVSHDLKTPLTSILGFAQALRDGRASDDADTRRMGQVIYEEASRLTTRLNDLLYLSEIEAGQAVLQRDEIDLHKLVESAVRRIESAVAARNVALRSELNGAVVVSADGAKLERAVENLLDNARKYTPSGGEIAVRTFAEPGAACVEVANTADDLEADELPRLFDRFYRRERARSGDETAGVSGSGLGLTIARDLVELHGGALSAGLQNGHIVFTARLPREEEPAAS